MSTLSVVILAAGQGKRMVSDLPKVLHPLAGRPLLQHVIDTARELGAERPCVVYGHGGDQVRERLADQPLEWALQSQQLGTGHAVAQALPHLPEEGTVLVLYGDVPLTGADTLRRLVELAHGPSLALITVELEHPAGYGRIVRDPGGAVRAIVEEKDADPDQLAIGEVNTGILAAPAARLREWLGRLGNDNAQGEYYLTDVIAMAVAEGLAVHTVHPGHAHEVLGVNNRVQLAELERRHQRAQAEDLLRRGVTLADPERFDLRGTLEPGRDVFIDVGCVLEGRVVLGDGVVLGPGCVVRDSALGAGTRVEPHSVIEQAVVGAGARIGPFARVRPETRLADGVHIGNFVEIKKSAVGAGSKINHLSYVGDSEVGSGVNIGAGTITCNYDGANKHRTVIGDDAFIGSDTQLVAPVTVGAGATIGAGSTITRDAPPGDLTLSRTKQQTRSGWKRPVKKPRE